MECHGPAGVPEYGVLAVLPPPFLDFHTWRIVRIIHCRVCRKNPAMLFRLFHYLLVKRQKPAHDKAYAS